MNGATVRIVSILFSSAVILGTGYWLARAGRPYGDLLFNAHKLLALAAIVLFVIVLVRTNPVGPWSAAKIAAVAAAGLSFLVLLATGGLHSIDAAGGLPADASALRAAVSILHKILPYTAAASAGVAILLGGTAP